MTFSTAHLPPVKQNDISVTRRHSASAETGQKGYICRDSCPHGPHTDSSLGSTPAGRPTQGVDGSGDVAPLLAHEAP